MSDFGKGELEKKNELGYLGSLACLPFSLKKGMTYLQCQPESQNIQMVSRSDDNKCTQ